MSYVTAHCPRCDWNITGLAVDDVGRAYRMHYVGAHDDRTTHVRTRTDPARIERDVQDQEDGP